MSMAGSVDVLAYTIYEDGRPRLAVLDLRNARDGTLTAFHAKILADLGGYHLLLTPMIPPLSAFVMCGVYATPAVQTDVVGVSTNKFPTDAIRGAGRPEATHMIEVTMDQLAEELGMDRLELRRKNFIPPFSAPDSRTTRHAGYALSQRARKRIEEVFGWMKTVGGMRKLRHRGGARVDWQFVFTAAVYNLVRIRNLTAVA